MKIIKKYAYRTITQNKNKKQRAVTSYFNYFSAESSIVFNFNVIGHVSILARGPAEIEP